MNPIIEKIYNQAKLNYKKIVLPEGEDQRTIDAAKIIRDQKIADIVLIDQSYIDSHSDLIKQLTEVLYELRKDKGLTLDQAQELIKNPLYFGTLMVQTGIVDGMVSGATHTTTETFRPALQIIKGSSESKLISSFFIMETNNPNLGQNGILFFADCGLNINPTAEELSEITLETAKSFKKITGAEPKVAMLSFSTNGSAKHESVDKVKTATELVKQKNPQLIIEGEIQADAALIPEVCDRKYPGNKLHGQANILIFPDINSGNIAYKLVERIANANAFGPLSQGIKKPINDLSRGCKTEDIVTTVAITSIQN